LANAVKLAPFANFLALTFDTFWPPLEAAPEAYRHAIYLDYESLARDRSIGIKS
jgi:hypothetical protein